MFSKVVFCCRLSSTTSPGGSTRLGAASSPVTPTPSGCGGTVASTRSCTTRASPTNSSWEKTPCSGSLTRHRWKFVSASAWTVFMLFYNAFCGTVASGWANGKVKVRFYITQYQILRIAQCLALYSPDRPVQSDAISSSLGSIQPYAACTHIHHCL